MDAKVKNCCLKCSQPYIINSMRPLKGRLPVLLPCTHTVCESCVRNAVKFSEPLQCQLCEHSVVLSPEESKQSKVESCTNTYIDLKEIILSSDINVGKCNECKNVTRIMCTQCDTVYCDSCFEKVHGAFQSLKMHTKETIGMKVLSSSCMTHNDRTQDYYCETCQAPLCVDCLLLGEKTCSTHKIISMKEKNACGLDKLKDYQDSVDEIYRRLTKTAVDIGNKLNAINSDKDSHLESDILARAIMQHYHKLHGIIQKQANEILKTVKEKNLTEKTSLETAKDEVAKNIRAAKTLLNKLKFVLNNNDAKLNVLELVKEAEKIMNIPWYLHKPEQSTEKPPFNLKTEVFEVLEGHLTLEKESSPGYVLLPGAQLAGAPLPPAPARPVFPPEVVRDVREIDVKTPDEQTMAPPKKAAYKPKPSIDYVPKFRPKSGSVSSNSMSEESGSTKTRGYKKKTPVQELVAKTLEEGSQELACVIHINSPGDFYMQRACHSGRLREMKKEFQAASSFPKPSASHVTEGSLLLAYCKVTSLFQRCRILSKSNEDPKHTIYYVFYIDRGQSDTVTINELRVLPVEAARAPALALHCTLANVQPLGGDWDRADSVLMHHIVSNKQSVMYVRRTLGATNLGLALECDVTTFEEGVNLARALVFHNRARFTDPNFKYHKVGLLEERPTLFYNSDMRKGSTEEVVITCILSPDKFFIRKTYLQEQYDKLCSDLDDTYNLKNKSGMVYCPEVGTVVACNVEARAEDAGGGGWRRGAVTALQSRAHVTLTLPDSGHELSLHYSNLRILQSRFYTVKALAVECHLGQISPTNKKWSKASVLLLQQYARRALHAQVLEPPGRKRSMGVILYDRTDPDNVLCINKELIEAKCAVNIGALTFEPPITQKIIQDKAPKERKPAKPKPKPAVTIMKKELLHTMAIKDEDLQVKLDKGPIKLEVKILSCQNPSQLYVSLVSCKDTLTALYDELQTYYDNTPPGGKEDWKPEDKCCVLHKKSKTWRRAVILQIDGDMARIFYTDFAVVDEVKLSEVKPLTEEFLEVRDGAFKCHLSGIMPAGGSEWPGISCEYLNEEIENYQRFFITKKGNIKDKSMPVELWVYHVTPGGALDPDKGEWRLFNAALVRQGLAIPNREEGGEDLQEDTLSLLPATGTVSEWLQLRPDADTIPREPDASGSESDRDSLELAPATPTLAWLPVEAITEETFDAIPTFVDNDGFVFLHDVCHEDTLEIIAKSLNAHFKDTECKRTDWVVGQSCVALYGLDFSFYRGRVIQIQDGNSCLLQFVDYGNVEVCSFKNMRRDLVMRRIPILATKCSLACINLVGGKKRLQAVEHMHQLIVDKRCSINVLDKDKDIIEIELRIGKQNICDLLVDIHFATFVNSGHQLNDTLNDSICESLDSGPDYIIEDENSSDTYAPAAATPPQKMDWNEMIESEEKQANDDNLTYTPVDVPTDSFKCTVAYIEKFTKLQLLVTEADREERDAALEEILEEIQMEGGKQPVAQAREGAACIAPFGDDGTWYRATVLRRDAARGLARVLYVDFGNSETAAAADVRASRPRWCAPPPRMLAAELHGLRVADAARLQAAGAAYRDLLMEREVVGRAVGRGGGGGGAVQVELRAAPGEPLLYQQLIDDGLLHYAP